MHNRHSLLMPSLRVLGLLAVASLLLGGCSWFSRNKDRTNYERATQTRPLEVPPDLDAPAGSAALTIPDASGPTRGVREGDRLVLGRPAEAAPPSVGITAVTAGAGNSLQVADNTASTWRRVGLALERMGGTTIQARDEAGLSYEIRAIGQTTGKAGWFKRAITLGKATKTIDNEVPLRVRVGGDGDASTVVVEGGEGPAATAAIRSVLASLRERLS